MVTQRLTAIAEIKGGVDPRLARELKAVSATTMQFAGRTTELRQDISETTRTLSRQRQSLRRVNEELEDAKRGSDNYRRLRKEATDLNRAISRGERNLAEFNDELQKVERQADGVAKVERGFNRARVAALALAGAGAAITAGITAAVTQSLNQFERLNQTRFDFPGLTAGQARAVQELADRYAVDEGRLADIFNEAGIRIGEFSAGVSDQLGELRDFNIPVDQILASTSDVREQTLLLAQAVSGLDNEAARAAAADILAGGAGGQALRQLAQYTGGIDALRAAVTQVDPELERNIATLDKARMATADVSVATARLRDEFVANLAPAITFGAGALTGFIEGLAGAADSAGPLGSALAVVTGGALTLGGAAFGLSEQLGQLGFAAVGISQGLPALTAGLSAARLGIIGVTKASIAFLFTPVGAAIVGITLAVAGLVFGIRALADHFGGFTNLWNVGLAGAKVAFFEFANLLTLQFRFIAKGLDGLIGGFNAFARIIPGLNEVDFSVEDRLFGGLDQRRAQARADLNKVAGRARAEAQAGDSQSNAPTAPTATPAIAPPPQAGAAPQGAPVTSNSLTFQSGAIVINVESLDDTMAVGEQMAKAMDTALVRRR